MSTEANTTAPNTIPAGGTPRYGPTYRKNELTLVCQTAQAGESLCLMGVAGTGKSNVTNFLHSDPYAYKPSYLGKETGAIHFPVIDGNTWDGTAEGMWKKMLTELNETTAHLEAPEPDPKIAHIYEDQRAFSELKQRLKALCQEQGQKVMFILDDFDDVIRQGPLDLLEQFNALRSDGNRGQLSYLLFTKRLPHILGQAHPLKGKSKFYDLFSQHVYALRLYNPEDEDQMLVYLNEGVGKPLRKAELAQIKKLAGGHARLTKLIFDLWRAKPPTSDDYVSYFLGQADIRGECRRVLQSLHEPEQAVALRLAEGKNRPEDQPVIQHLIHRGLLANRGEWEWFSPVFAQFLQMEEVR